MVTMNDPGVEAALERLGAVVAEAAGDGKTPDPKKAKVLAMTYITGLTLNLMPPSLAVITIDVQAAKLARAHALVA